MHNMKQFFILSFLLVVRSLTVEAQFANNGAIRLFPGTSVTFFGDLTNNGTWTDFGTVVTLAGSSPQTIGGTSVTTFNNLTVNNTGATGVTLAQDVNVSGALVLVDGYVNTTAANIMGLNNNATTAGASNNSFVSGPVSKTGNQAIVFPVGKNTVYAPIAIAAPGLSTDIFTAEYFQVSPNPSYSVNSKEVTLDHVSQCEYWILDRTNGTSNVTVNLSWDVRSCDVTNLSDLRVARWDGTQWTDNGNGGTTGTTTAGTVVSSAPVTAFSPFTLASISPNNPLPVGLVDFTVECEGNAPVLRWSTASEVHNDFFTIESSSDAKDWTTTANIDGAGNSTVLINYAYTDVSNPGRNTYYRLKQTDMDGTFADQGIRYLASCAESSLENGITVYPNPSENGGITIATEEEILAVSVVNSEGKRIAVDINLVDKWLHFTNVPEGIYFIEITTPTKIINQKVTILAHVN